MSRRTHLTLTLLSVAIATTLGACGAPTVPEPRRATTAIESYLVDPAFRRAELEGSLVSRTNLYAKRRLASYTESAWGALPEWNPRVLPARKGAPPGPNEDFVALTIPEDKSEKELLELGRRAFVSYPLQLSDYAAPALKRADSASRYGLYDPVASDHGPGGLVAVKVADGTVHLAVTCATCHAKIENGTRTLGKTNDALRIDLLEADAYGTTPEAWGPGRVDVTADEVDNPTAVTDLRPMRFQQNIHRAGTLRNGTIPLAIRLETLTITSLGEVARPPREIALGLALYVWSLGERLAEPTRNGEGARIFEGACGRCHQGAALSGPAVPFDEVRTDEAIILGPERTTGLARVPSLRGVARRSPLLSSGSVPSLEALLAPTTERPTGGHTFGQDLSATDRAALLGWLRTLE